jgi:hypothetical protein
MDPSVRSVWDRVVRSDLNRGARQAKRSQGACRGLRAGAILPMVKKSLRDDLLNLPLERISVEPHIHLS